jgi:hypothetical protein
MKALKSLSGNFQVEFPFDIMKQIEALAPFSVLSRSLIIKAITFHTVTTSTVSVMISHLSKQ